jgi:hypothetical protein
MHFKEILLFDKGERHGSRNSCRCTTTIVPNTMPLENYPTKFWCCSGDESPLFAASFANDFLFIFSFCIPHLRLLFVHDPHHIGELKINVSSTKLLYSTYRFIFK